MKIVIAAEKHIPEIIELWKEFMDFQKDIDPYLGRGEDGHIKFENQLRDLMKSGDNLILVALDKDHVIGYSVSLSPRTLVLKTETYGFISDMAVQSNYRRQGIGEQMLAKIYEWFESRNIDRIELTVVAKNQIGYSFWRKHGFKDYIHRLYLDRG